jgi:hypothetical protein
VGIRLFDLNIEEVLENWEVHHALRELIANALDEQILSKTADPRIIKEGNEWHIRDFGRGLRIEHFTQNESKEKLGSQSGVIGKFGVGLKDALATLHRHGVGVQIRSAYGSFRLRTAEKTGFKTIQTLHVEYDDQPADLLGTDIILSSLRDADVALAKNLFLRFAAERVLESTSQYGDVLERQSSAARVYVTGVLAAEEPNFLFSYNITSLTAAMRKKLNRERINVGRSTYTERVIAILKQCRTDVVTKALCDQALKSKGDQCDEMQWIEISQLALNLLSTSQQGHVGFITEQEWQAHPDVIDNMRRDGLQVVVVGDAQQAKLQQQVESGGTFVRTMDTYVVEYNRSFEYQYVDASALTKSERAILDHTSRILELLGIKLKVPIRISETLRADLNDTNGVWDSSESAIVIKRTALASLERYGGVLAHEVGHATTGATDVSRDFEGVLTDYLGRLASKAIRG